MNITPSKLLTSLPPYVFVEIDKKVAALRAQGVDVIDFGVGDPTEPTPDFITSRLSAFAKKHATSGYPSFTGSKEFRSAATAYMKRRFQVSINLDREICASSGSKEAIFKFPKCIIDPGDIVICPSPGFPLMKTGTLFAGGIPYFVPLLEKNDFLIDYKAIPEKIAIRAKIIWLNYPNSPTGAVASRKYYKGLIEWAHKYNIVIAADEGCYIDIYYDEPPPSILEVGREGIIAFYSLSKRNNMTGYRVGFVCGDERLISIFQCLKTNIDSGVPHIVQEAAILALQDDSHVETLRSIYRSKRDILLAGLKAVGFPIRHISATFYVWQKISGDDVAFTNYLLDARIAIAVTPGSLISDECHGGINPGEGYVRFALMPPALRIEEAVQRLRSAPKILE